MFDLSTLPPQVAKLVQHGLSELGFYEGSKRGKPGPRTKAAFENYLKRHFPVQNADEVSGSDPRWLIKARHYDGVSEIKGDRHHPAIIRWWKLIKSYIRDDESPWCAAFVGGVLEECGIESSRKANARSYLNWGKACDGPKQGAIVVFWRGSRTGWKGHVGFVEGVDARGNILVYGGNQSDSVNLKAFPTDRVLGYRWPASENLNDAKPADLLAGDHSISISEA